MLHALKAAFAAGLVLFLFSSIFAYSGGTGEPNDPYQISTRADLLQLSATAADYIKSFVLTADIDLDPCLPGGQVFTNAINRAAIFQGQFDGNNHKIANFSISGYDGLGLFLWIAQSASVKNLIIENCFIQCNFSVSGGKNIGALAGTNSGTITNCSATGTINGNLYSGGLVGWNQGNITDCFTNALVTTAGNVIDHTNPGSTGGLVGVNYASSGRATIRNCYSSGTVNATANSGAIGGLVGYNDIGGDIKDSYSTASVSGGLYIGGLVGTVGSPTSVISNCYSTGAVSGTSEVGGLIGQTFGSAPGSFWDTQTSGKLTSAAGTGKTTAEMKTLSTFTSAGWDFATVWGMGNGQTYPYLKPFNGFNVADLNFSGAVDFQDFAIFTANWLSTQ